MDDVVQAIENLSIRDWTDYLAIFAPFVLSIVAVCVSITTARKQNKIALFEKRYEAYRQLIKCISFSMLIDNEDDREDLYMYFDAALGNKIVPDRKITWNDIHPLYQKTIGTLKTASFLFDADIKDVIDNLSFSLISLVDSAEDPNTNDDKFCEKKYDFIKCANRIKKEYQKAIESELKI